MYFIESCIQVCLAFVVSIMRISFHDRMEKERIPLPILGLFPATSFSPRPWERLCLFLVKTLILFAMEKEEESTGS